MRVHGAAADVWHMFFSAHVQVRGEMSVRRLDSIVAEDVQVGHLRRCECEYTT
jgi:hypothetical protein